MYKTLLQGTKSVYRFPKIFRAMLNHSSTGKLLVEPLSSIVTEPVSISGSNFQANAPLTIQASVNCPSEKLLFTSKAYLFSNDNGCFNLWDTESHGGNYSGTYGMGLFWSMISKADSYRRFQVTNASTPLAYDFHIFDGHISEPEDAVPIDTVTINRYFIKKSTTRVTVKSGNIRGTMFIPEGSGPFPAIITLYGGNKRRAVVEDAAGILSNHGYVTLALAYFGVDDLPKAYSTQPIRIEYFEEAVQFLSDHNKVNENAIGIYGESKGGELALAMVSHLPQIRAVAGINSCISSVATTLTYKDKSTDMLGRDIGRVEFFPDQTLNIKNALNNPKDEPNSIHKFETSEADVLMIAGSDDYNWKSELYIDIAKERMDNVGKSNYETIKYPGLGHFIDAPFMPPCVTFGHPLTKGLLVYFGGKDTIQHSTHQVDIWKKVITFYNKSLKVSSKL